MNCPFFVLHYKKNHERRAHLERSFASSPIKPIYIEELDQAVYQYDEAAFARMVMHIKDNWWAGRTNSEMMSNQPPC
jgi:hypothetical protein